jgi:hypothetical protein
LIDSVGILLPLPVSLVAYGDTSLANIRLKDEGQLSPGSADLGTMIVQARRQGKSISRLSDTNCHFAALHALRCDNTKSPR